MVYTTNQNRQFYVAKAYNANVNESSAAGTLGAVKCIDNGLDKEFYFLYKGADSVMKSDIIPLKNLSYVKAVAAADMRTPLKAVKVELDSAVNSGDPVKGQDYVLRINFRQFFGPGDQHQYFKDAAVHVTAAMEADVKEFYKAMVNALNLSFSREMGATANSNPYLAFSAGTSGSEDGIYITEKAQPWILGIKNQERVYFDVVPTTIYSDGDDVIWGTVTDTTPDKASAVVGTNALGNGKKIADLEYFCMGERGDQYRGINWPNDVTTTYLVNPANEYNVLELHYAFTDTGVNSYRSEKDITIVAETSAIINSIIGAINTATSLTISTLP